MEKKRSNFTGSIGFVLAAAGSAVGLGNIWRFPYLAAKGGGGVFILCYVVLALTFGFTLLTTEIAIGRKTGQSPLTAYEQMHKGWGGIGVLACAVPVIILPWIRAGGCGKCSRAGEHLEIPVSGSKRWRRSVYSVLCGTGTYLWVYVADNRDRDRT